VRTREAQRWKKRAQNFKEAVEMVLQANRKLTGESLRDPTIYGNA
jgi:hypothetical protein